jgi:hypothetical protein
MRLCIRLSAVPAIAATGLLLGAGGARADSCIDLRTGQNYDCNQAPPSQSSPGQPAAAKPQLRDQLRKSLGSASPTRSETAQEKWVDAAARAQQATDSARLTSDPQEKAQFKRNYDAAMRDLRQAGNDMMASTSDPKEKAMVRDTLQKYEAAGATAAADAGLGSTPQPTQQATAPAAPANDVFSVCEEPVKGVTTCYEIGRTGSDCLEVWYQGGLRTLERGRKACSAADLAQRNAYFSGQPVGQGAPADPRSQQLSGLMASLSPRCQTEVQSYLYNSRDSQTSRDAGTKAMKSFADINSDLECKAGFERLAGILGVQMPQRKLAARTGSTWGSAMADKPRETVNVPDVRDMPQGYYGEGDSSGGWNTGEVLSTGIQVLGVLADILGGFAAGYAGGGYSYGGGGGYTTAPSRGYGGPTGGGYVYRGGSSGGSQSTITGGRR